MAEDPNQNLPAPPPISQTGGYSTGPIQPATSSMGRDTGALLSLIGGVLVVAGVFLPWVSATNGVASDSHNGISIGTYGTLFLGAIAAARGLSAMRGQAGSSSRRGNSMITGGLILGLIALRWNTIQAYLKDERAISGVTASIGPGVWLVIAGGALVFAGGALVWMRQRSST